MFHRFSLMDAISTGDNVFYKSYKTSNIFKIQPFTSKLLPVPMGIFREVGDGGLKCAFESFGFALF